MPDAAHQTVVTLHNRMTEADYEAERAALRATYGDDKYEADAMRVRALAMLFARSGWTQEDLAEKEGKSQTWVAQNLLFGRFLNIAVAINPETLPTNLKEGTFRKYWKAADACGGNERQRFALVARAIQAGAELKLPREHTDLAPRIIKEFGDGNWHAEQTIVEHFSDDDPADVLNRLKTLAGVGSHNTRAERQKHGRGHRIRLFRQERTISTAEIRTKLLPLIEGLKTEGRKNMATMVPAAVARLAALLERQLDAWEQ